MTTRVLDLTTMGHALNELSCTYLGNTEWQPANTQQAEFLDWYKANREQIAKLNSLEALASTDYTVLNSFLSARGFEPMFRPFTGVGVASILDMLVEWAEQANLATIFRHGANWRVEKYSAFELPARGADVFTVQGWEHPLACLHTKTGHKLWLMKVDSAPTSGIDLALTAQQILNGDRKLSLPHTAGVKVPTIEIDTMPALDWMLGCSTTATNGSLHAIEQAFQQYKLRINHEGARIKVATGFAARGGPIGPVAYEFNSPFIGFFTQPGHDDLALAAFYADTDSWLAPKGSLQDL